MPKEETSRLIDPTKLCGILFLLVSVLLMQACSEREQEQLENTTVQQTPVTTTLPVLRDLETRLAAFGSLYSPLRTKVAAEVEGTVISIAVDEGSAVKRGQTLATIDSAFYLTELKQRTAETRALQLGLDRDLQLNLPQLSFSVNHLRTADFGLASSDIGGAISLLMGGLDVAKYNDKSGDGQRYDIRLKANTSGITGQNALQHIYLRTARGDLVRLDSITTSQRQLGPAVINRFDQQYATTFYATPTVSLGEAITRVHSIARGLLPPGYEITMIGRAEAYTETIGYMLFALGTGLLLVYMVLASQFLTCYGNSGY
ncbi:MAG: efflux RND transporter permease subunit [Gammaproteobacteria bacterium]|nr:efflux RND transporter permease subunit [Gammaproteobacteria bacterium]